MFKKPDFKVVRTADEIAARCAQLQEDWQRSFTRALDTFHRECAVRMSVLQARHDPDEAEKRWRGTSDYLRYCAVSESHWLYGYDQIPRKVTVLCNTKFR